MKILLNLLARLWAMLCPPKIEEIEYIPVEPKPIEPMLTNEEKFIKVCLDALDTDPTPKDEISDDVACAHVISTLIKKVLPDFPILASTKDLDFKLFSDKRFKKVDLPNKGRIVISPRTPKINGHVGVYITNERIASNTSKDGIFRGNYDYLSWKEEMEYKRKLKTYYYEFID